MRSNSRALSHGVVMASKITLSGPLNFDDPCAKISKLTGRKRHSHCLF